MLVPVGEVMNGLNVRSRRRAVAAALAAAGVLFAFLVPTSSRASTAITITSGGCSGGGFEFCFMPESAAATAGSQVSWTNASGVGHTATSCTSSACPGAPANTGSDTFAVNVDTSGSFTFHSAGTYIYYCSIHGYAAMHGAIHVSASSTPTPAPTPTPTVRPTATPTARDTLAPTPTPTSSVAGVTAPSSGAAAGTPPSTSVRSPAPRSLGASGATGGFPVAALLIVLAGLLAGGAAGAIIRRRAR